MEKNKFILVTGHRENFGDGFKKCNAIKDLSIKYKNIHFVTLFISILMFKIQLNLFLKIFQMFI